MTNDDVWHELRDSLQHEPWEAIVIHRHGREPVDLLCVGETLFVHDGDVCPAERAALCRMGFVRSGVRGGPYWMWIPPSSRRPRRLGAGEVRRTIEVFETCRRQLNRKVPRVLRDVFAATPFDVMLLLEAPEEQPEEQPEGQPEELAG